jgi:alpha-D-ribose 1-methylphosphonate 5-triphosphate synthase subunit PhnI
MYVATKGGEAAIQQAEKLFQTLKGPVTREVVQQIQESLPYLVDRVMGEGSLYSPELAALALAQAGGDLYEAVLLLRAYRSTQPRIAYATPVRPESMLTVRRISAAFKDIPGGQILGPTLDYSHRILKLDVLDGKEPDEDEAFVPAEKPAPTSYPAVADWQRMQGLMAFPPTCEEVAPADIPDITSDTVLFPAPREHRLQALARADTGGLLALGYASMRGYGLIHPTVNELRLAHADVQVKHLVTGATFSAGRIRVSQGEIVTTGGSEKDGLTIGFAATMGWNEIKLIAASTLDMEMNQPSPNAHHTEEFVMYHTESVEASGFCIHFKLPHYVTFASSLDNLRKLISTFYSSEERNKDKKQAAGTPSETLESIKQATP